jgi:hypothetical protein
MELLIAQIRLASDKIPHVCVIAFNSHELFPRSTLTNVIRPEGGELSLPCFLGTVDDWSLVYLTIMLGAEKGIAAREV